MGCPRHGQAGGRSPVSGGIGRSTALSSKWVGNGRSTASAGEQDVGGSDEQSQGPGRISRSPASASGGESTVSANEAWQTIRQVHGFGGRGRRHQRAIARSRQAVARSKISMSDQPGLWRWQEAAGLQGLQASGGPRRWQSRVGCQRHCQVSEEVPGVRRDRQVRGIGR